MNEKLPIPCEPCKASGLLRGSVRVVVNGDRLDIQASVDLAGLKTLQSLLKQYEGILEMTARMAKKEAAN
jgi:hypothetical protein